MRGQWLWLIRWLAYSVLRGHPSYIPDDLIPHGTAIATNSFYRSIQHLSKVRLFMHIDVFFDFLSTSIGSALFIWFQRWKLQVKMDNIVDFFAVMIFRVLFVA